MLFSRSPSSRVTAPRFSKLITFWEKAEVPAEEWALSALMWLVVALDGNTELLIDVLLTRKRAVDRKHWLETMGNLVEVTP